VVVFSVIGVFPGTCGLRPGPNLVHAGSKPRASARLGLPDIRRIQTMKLATLVILCGLLLAPAAFAVCVGPTVDGVLDAAYGTAKCVQQVQTQFGDNNNGTIDWANGSELDAGYCYVVCNSLYLFLPGNLESNYNKLEVFIDSKAGGQNKLRNDNPNVDYDGLNRMGDDGSGNGLTFDAGFEADYYLTCGGGWNGSAYALYVNYAEMVNGGVGNYLGTTGAGGPGTLTGGTNPDGIEVAINNLNGAGVTGGCDAASGAGVATGIEWMIPLAAIGNPTGPIKVCAFINGGGHDYLANQVLGSLPVPTCNLGEPRNVNFNNFAGNQYFMCGDQPTPAQSNTWGGLKRLYR
jgi:hypothetical protein